MCWGKPSGTGARRSKEEQGGRPIGNPFDVFKSLSALIIIMFPFSLSPPFSLAITPFCLHHLLLHGGYSTSFCRSSSLGAAQSIESCLPFRYYSQLNVEWWRWLIFKQHRDTQETLAVLDRLDLDTDKPSDEELARKFGFEEAYYNGELSWWQKTKPKIWSLFDEPYSSNSAKVKTFDIIILSLYVLCIWNGQTVTILFCMCITKTKLALAFDVVRVYQFRSECLDDGLRQRKWWPREREEDETALKAKL